MFTIYLSDCFCLLTLTTNVTDWIKDYVTHLLKVFLVQCQIQICPSLSPKYNLILLNFQNSRLASHDWHHQGPDSVSNHWTSHRCRRREKLAIWVSVLTAAISLSLYLCPCPSWWICCSCLYPVVPISCLFLLIFSWLLYFLSFTSMIQGDEWGMFPAVGW